MSKPATPLDQLTKKPARLLRKLKNVIRHGGWAPIVILIVSVALPGTISEINKMNPKLADLYFVTPATTLTTGQSATVELRVRTNGTAVNAMGFKLLYNPLYLEATGMTTESSFCTHYIENSFNNQIGVLKLSCGIPRPGFQGDSLAVKVTFRTKLPGNPDIIIDKDSLMLLANDGKGSKIVREAPTLTLNVQQL